MTRPKIGFLFDVDGTLTTYHVNDSVIDLLIINDLEMIRKMDFPIGLITGRSVQWVRNYFFNHINDTLKEYIPIFGEFGLVNWYRGKKVRKRISKELRELLRNVKQECSEAICEYRELEPYEDFVQPDQRKLWIEPKEIMITFRTLPLYGLTTEKLLRNIEPIVKEYANELKIIPNPYAIDILPIETSKKTAAEKAIRTLDKEKVVTKWYSFGDSETDREMSYAKNADVNFYKIPRGVTREAHLIIQRLLAGSPE
ncbi:MAG: HAD-IIB family hydrolase [Candidatus Heimdallarchaeota archaeon]|nr:MAG: HAD-IIB family hydrolase [Candidatus Heimdallarchaeota archaeon]